MKYLYLIWSNLKRHKLRSVLTMLSILVAFLLFGLLGAIRTAFTAGIDVADLERLIVRHKVSLVQLLPASYEARMEKIEGVEQAVAQTWFGGYYQDPRNQFAQMPVDPAEFMEVFPEYLLPDEQRDAWLNTRTGAIAGRSVAERLGWESWRHDSHHRHHLDPRRRRNPVGIRPGGYLRRGQEGHR